MKVFILSKERKNKKIAVFRYCPFMIIFHYCKNKVMQKINFVRKTLDRAIVSCNDQKAWAGNIFHKKNDYECNFKKGGGVSSSV